MEFEFKKNGIVFDKPLSDLDNFCLKFVKLLDLNSIDYVIVSGYIAILFGRSRETEDIDIISENISFEVFEKLWNSLLKEFWCINTDDSRNAYENYLMQKTGVRFALIGKMMPNIEFKFKKTNYDFIGFKNKIEILLNGKKINSTILELQIAFKLYLGSDKDFEDARHLYKMFKEYLDKNKLQYYITDLLVEKAAKKVLSDL